ncbi:MAG: hypothetical protein E7513_05960 [Ruminococcaceae bacterium]|nr:hypothetical protein [Oscillospiraceae bacterium]
MDVKIENMDMVTKNCSDPLYIEGIEEIAQRVKIACTIKKGNFVYDTSLGSFSHTVDLSDAMAKDKLEMIFKEATIDIPYTSLRVIELDEDNKKAVVEITYGTDCALTEVIVDG